MLAFSTVVWRKVIPSSSMPLLSHFLLICVYRSGFAAVQRIGLWNQFTLTQIGCCLVSFSLDLCPDSADYVTAEEFCQQRAKVKQCGSKSQWLDRGVGKAEILQCEN